MGSEMCIRDSKNNTELLDFIGKNFGPLQVRAYAEPTNGNIIDNRNDLFVRLSGTLNQQVDTTGAPANNDNYNGVDPYNISSGITIVNVTSQSTNPETWANTNSNLDGNNNTTAPYLIKITPGLGPLLLKVNFGINRSGDTNYVGRLNMYTNQDCLTADKTVVLETTGTSTGHRQLYGFLPNLAATRYFGLSFDSNTTNHGWTQNSFYVEISRAAGNIADVADASSLTQITP